jgi:hypothetical protein
MAINGCTVGRIGFRDSMAARHCAAFAERIDADLSKA